MAKQAYRTTNFRGESLERIEQMNEIIEEYQAQGLRLTARQLYYQFVSRDLIPNNPKAYKNLTALLTDARYAGLVDWDAIEDRGREPNSPSEWDSIKDLTEGALRAYRLPRWKGQKNYVELWVEKQALAGVLEPIARQFHVTLMVNKGYSSASAMKESADRMKEACGFTSDEFKALMDEGDEELNRLDEEYGDDSTEYQEKKEEWGIKLRAMTRCPIVFYLGDHDPSGEDMVRDIETRLKEFGVLRLQVEKLGLTMEQVRKYKPPPNPAKVTDPRAGAYRAKFGDSSWEVDALPPNVLTQIIRVAFNAVVDKKLMDEIKVKEELDKTRLREAVAKL